MRHLSLAEIRTAAKSLAVRDGKVTELALAGELGVKSALVREYLNGIKGFREELNVPKAESVAERNLRVILAMHKASITITLERIAALTGSNTKSLRIWCNRHAHELQEIELVSGVQARRRRAIIRVKWILRLRGQTSVTKMAREVGYERATLSRLLHGHYDDL